MPYSLVGRPSSKDAMRADFDEFVTQLEFDPEHRITVVFGFAWGNSIYEGDWLDLELSGSELRERVAAAEASKLGKIGDDDLFIRLPSLGIERLYCHEADIHINGGRVDHPYVDDQRQKWIDRGWMVHSHESD